MLDTSEFIQGVSEAELGGEESWIESIHYKHYKIKIIFTGKIK